MNPKEMWNMSVHKIIRPVLAYAIAALAAGVYYREMTKLFEFSGSTALSAVHSHLLALGVAAVLIVGLYDGAYNLRAIKGWNLSWKSYHIGVIWVVTAMVARGTIQVLDIDLSKAADAAVAGASGMGHILLAFGIIRVILAILKAVKSAAKQAPPTS
jgi:hypothetical protein